jgi:hypothetical protein
MNKPLKDMLRASIEAQRQRALTTLQLLAHHSVGIGDHSTEDYYKNAEEALAALAEADDKLETLNRYEFKLESGEYVVIKDGKRQ